MNEQYILWSDGKAFIYRCECCGELGMRVVSKACGYIRDGLLKHAKYPATLNLSQPHMRTILTALVNDFPEFARGQNYAKWVEEHGTQA